MEVDGALADFGGPRQRAVLLRLLVGQGSSVSVDRLLTYWIMDNGSSHRGQASVERLHGGWRNLRLVHLPTTHPGSIRWKSTSR